MCEFHDSNGNHLFSNWVTKAAQFVKSRQGLVPEQTCLGIH